MQNPVADFLRSSLIPELRTNIAAGAACDIHPALVGVAALRAAPDQFAGVILDNLDFAVETALLAVIALRIQFRIHDVVVDEADHLQNRLKVVLHIRNFNVADRAARGERLELRFKRQLGERVDFFRDMDVVAVRNVVFVGNSGNHAEAFLQTLGELVCR